MDDFYSLEKLEVFQIANEIGESVWLVVNNWGYFEKDTIGKQFVRSADSISANIAEGYGRYFFKENIQFCYYSRGSLLETKVWLLKTKTRNLISNEQYEDVNGKVEQLLIKLNGYINYLKKNHQNHISK
jgi:four helix bundle protein